MPAPYEFFVIIEQSTRTKGQLEKKRFVQYLPLDQAVSKELETSFTSMCNNFITKSLIKVNFDGRYTPSGGERFAIPKFSMNPNIVKAAKSPLTTPILDLSNQSYPLIKAIIATQVIQEGNSSKLRIIFQEFRTGSIIRRGRALFHRNDTFQTSDQSGLAISDKIDAVFENGELNFRSYYTANRFVDLTPYFKEATKLEIRDMLDGDNLVSDDLETLLENADAVISRKFGIIKQTQILDKVTPEQIQK
ncbi:MAG: hypothetical protein JKY95_04985, partial [Planctomycetaceae bacterium]|nr:hypothetical protein [Planctomycetaceae bacterium]